MANNYFGFYPGAVLFEIFLAFCWGVFLSFMIGFMQYIFFRWLKGRHHG
jgi:hypothetical protein